MPLPSPSICIAMLNYKDLQGIYSNKTPSAVPWAVQRNAQFESKPIGHGHPEETRKDTVPILDCDTTNKSSWHKLTYNGRVWKLASFVKNRPSQDSVHFH